ncbi:MAG: hypothetical protein KKH94_13910 [Candidatus Omnitrophica bacterium]|nr:hypothetical protein [Candidatus Omnitrophota bacterium]
MNDITTIQWDELNNDEKQAFQQKTSKNFKINELPSRMDMLVFVGKTMPEFEAVKSAANGGPFNESGYSNNKLWEMVKSSLRNK